MKLVIVPQACAVQLWCLQNWLVQCAANFMVDCGACGTVHQFLLAIDATMKSF
jgi:uncharacterized Zn finger protein